ncbi:MAG: hypothetical protein ACM3Y9_12625 [Ignavibacteria bacterium]
MAQLSKASILVLLCVVSAVAPAQTQEPVRIIKEGNGNVVNFRAEGSLASTQAVNCIPLAEAKNSFTPPDLYKGVLDCLARDNYESAAELFALAGIYGRFDAERVADKTAGQAKTVLIMNAFAAVSDEKKSRFNAALGRITGSPEVLGRLCRQVAAVGMPDYYPSYMILHGIRAFTGNPHEGAIVKDFDASGVWKNLQSAYLHCPA